MWMKQSLNKLRQIVRKMFSNHPTPSDVALDREMLRKMIQEIMSTRPDEIDCGECFEELDRFAEMKLAGKNAAEAMPLVQDHLDRCANCREVFEALLAALRAVA